MHPGNVTQFENLTRAAAIGLYLFAGLIFEPEYLMNTNPAVLFADSVSYHTNPII